jgi:hypothetical protein
MTDSAARQRWRQLGWRRQGWARPGRPAAAPAHKISRALAARMVRLAPELLPAGRPEAGGREWRCGGLDGGAGRSLAIELAGERAGLWHDFATGESGDALDLVAQILFDGDIGRALGWARGWLGQAAQVPERPPPGSLAPRPAPAASDERHGERQWAEAVWSAARRLTRGDPVDRYLADRGVSLAALAAGNGGKLPGALPLRFHPRLKHKGGGYWPAMVAAILDPAGRFAAVHRTWLAVAAGGAVTKAPLEDAKMSLGPAPGGAIRLWGPPWREAVTGDLLVISEGIEDGLSAIGEGIEDRLPTVAPAPQTGAPRPILRFCAARSVSAIGSIVLPREFERIVVLQQNDEPGSEAARALDGACAKLRAEGHEIWRHRVRDRSIRDLNELLQVRLRREGECDVPR